MVHPFQSDVWFLATDFKITAASIFAGGVLKHSYILTFAFCFFIYKNSFSQEDVGDLVLANIYFVKGPDDF